MDRRRRWRVSNGRRGCNMRRRRPGRWRRCPAESCGRCRRMRGWRLRRTNHRRRNRTGGRRARSCAPGSLGRGRGMGSWSPRRARKRSRSWPRCVDRGRRGLSTAIFPRRSALSDRRARQVMRRAGLRQRGSLPRGREAVRTLRLWNSENSKANRIETMERSRGIWTNLFGGSKKNSEKNSENSEK